MSDTSSDVCPFKVGDTVVFTHKWGKAGLPGRDGIPEVGERLRITGIKNGNYIQWSGMEGSLDGIHWVEFSRVPDSDLF
jgi:hypothetical protein